MKWHPPSLETVIFLHQPHQHQLQSILQLSIQIPNSKSSSLRSSLKHLDLGGYDSISQPVLWNLSYARLLLSLLSYTFATQLLELLVWLSCTCNTAEVSSLVWLCFMQCSVIAQRLRFCFGRRVVSCYCYEGVRGRRVC